MTVCSTQGRTMELLKGGAEVENRSFLWRWFVRAAFRVSPFLVSPCRLALWLRLTGPLKRFHISGPDGETRDGEPFSFFRS